MILHIFRFSIFVSEESKHESYFFQYANIKAEIRRKCDLSDFLHHIQDEGLINEHSVHDRKVMCFKQPDLMKRVLLMTLQWCCKTITAAVKVS